MLGDTEHHRQGWFPALRTPWILSPWPRHHHGCARWDSQSRQRRKQPKREYLARRRLQHGRYPGRDVPRSRPHRSRTRRSTSACEGRCPGAGRARARMAHRTQTGRRLHPHDTRENSVLGLFKFNAGPGLASPSVVDRHAERNLRTSSRSRGFWLRVTAFHLSNAGAMNRCRMSASIRSSPRGR